MSIVNGLYKPYVLIEPASDFDTLVPLDNNRYKSGEVVEIHIGCDVVAVGDMILYDSQDQITILTPTTPYLLISTDKIIAKPNVTPP